MNNMSYMMDYDQKVHCACLLVQGLLASGHFTERAVSEDEEPGLLQYDVGKDWVDHARNRRWQAYVLDEALDLLEQLEEDIQRPWGRQSTPEPAAPTP